MQTVMIHGKLPSLNEYIDACRRNRYQAAKMKRDAEELIIWQAKKNVDTEIFKSQNRDSVNHPSHYTSGGIECIDCIKAALGENFIGFLIGNVIKYSYRYKDKNGIEDLKKAKWYLESAIKEVKENDD